MFLRPVYHSQPAQATADYGGHASPDDKIGGCMASFTGVTRIGQISFDFAVPQCGCSSHPTCLWAEQRKGSATFEKPSERNRLVVRPTNRVASLPLVC